MKEKERNNNSSRNVLFAVLGNQPQASHTLDNQSATEQVSPDSTSLLSIFLALGTVLPQQTLSHLMLTTSL